ncbi:hypothetical protein BDR06DRAFT_981634 [Suillus hirtellus]|nr:hypothetical protein BDR06DRAFT_981634 [Suillus hirtellus]
MKKKRIWGRGNDILQDECNCKGEGKLLYCCHDCFGVEMMCHMCVLNKHAHNPLHRIKEWHGTFFIQISLKSLGLHVQLGHHPEEKCYNPEPATADDFIIINVHGIHEIGLDFCGCETVQFFHLLSFESKVSAYEFYHSIAQQTGNTSITPIRDHYSVFMCMVHEWHHLKQLKHAGRGHDPCGVDATSAGACTVLCPACPQPSKNLPDNWENAPQETRWIYALFLTIDTNFWLKQKLISSDNVDPSLNAGWSYFVEEMAYKQYLSECGCELQEKSTCISHNAVNMANVKTSRGLAAMGVGTVDCTRHDMKLPNGVGDLQKGEKYLNMDYFFLVFIFNLSYNFHLNAHIQPCQTTFSFNFSKNVGCTDGEAPERGWVNINHVALSTKEMGPGACSLSLSAWRSEIILWEEDHTKPNPFENRLAKKNAADLQAGADVLLHAEISPSILIASGIDLQDQHNTLQCRLDNWVRIQVLYMPAVTPICFTEEANQSQHTTTPKPEDFKLWLPSELNPHIPCYCKLCNCEWELHYAQAHDTLNDVQQNILLFAHLNTFKIANMHAGKAKYDVARAALVALAPWLGKIGWSDILRPLLVLDMRPMGDFIQGQSEGTHGIPWIWKTPGVLQDNDKGLQDCTYLAHWSEEVTLLLKKMRRVLAFLTWQVKWWSGLSSACHFKRLADIEGSATYVKRQSMLQQGILEKFR